MYSKCIYQQLSSNSRSLQYLSEMLTADFPVCLPSLPLCSRAGQSDGFVHSGQHEEGNVAVFSTKGNFQIELDLVKLFNFPQAAAHCSS